VVRGGVARGAGALGACGAGALGACGAGWRAAAVSGAVAVRDSVRSRLPAERSVSGPAAVMTGMTLVIAHIGGIPVEETVAGFGPVVAVAGGCCIATLRARWRRVRGMDRED